MTNSLSPREAFEAWGDKARLSLAFHRENDAVTYDSTLTEVAWRAWQARAALLEPVGEGSLLEQARIALGLMLSYHGQGNSDYADVAQVKAQEAYDAIEDAIAASPKSNGGMGS